jgi:ABC-type cobalamin transport system ATPase subunit
VLLEREREIAELGDLVDGVRDGRGATVLLEAPAGLGKSTLLARAADLAAERGVGVLHARARELERETAWGVARSLLGDDAVLQAAPAGDAGFAILHGL